MAVQHAAYLFAIAVGFVSAGIIGSLWNIATDEEPRLVKLFDANPTLMTPLRVFAIIFSAPTTVLLHGFEDVIARPFLGIPVLGAALLWSFMQGVFILTQIFGVG
jgi:hypothetical protein